MTLYEDGYITLDYDEPTDILCVTSPDITTFDLLQVHRAFTIITENLRKHDIKRFIMDVSRSRIDVSDEEHQVVMEQLAHDLATTSLQKMAWIVSEEPEQAKNKETYLRQSVKEQLPYRIKNFRNRNEAEKWLKKD